MRNEARTRIVVCGGAYSDNLGDVIIAECLWSELGRLKPRSDIVFLDLAGRRSATHVHFRHKQEVRYALARIPEVLKRPLVFVGLGMFLRRKIEPVWREVLDRGDFLVMGGGHILQDDNLNYPKKLLALDRIASELGARRAIQSVGVSRAWSGLGREMFARLFDGDGLVYCSVRDESSKDNLIGHLPLIEAESVFVNPDPALLADRVFPAPTGDVDDPIDIGMCVADPSIVGRDEARASGSFRHQVGRKWARLVEAIATRGFSVGLFTNGAKEDEAFLDELSGEVATSGGARRLSRATDAAGYVQSLRRMRCVIGHRLHAAIVSYSLGIPCMGFVWDPKVESFFELCERPEWAVDFEALSIEELVRKADELVGSSLDARRRSVVVGSCEEGIRRLASVIDATETAP